LPSSGPSYPLDPFPQTTPPRPGPHREDLDATSMEETWEALVVRIEQHRSPEAKGGVHGCWGGRNPRDLTLPWQRGSGHAVGGGSGVWGEAEVQVLRAHEAKGDAADAHLHHELKASSLCYASGKEFVPIARRQALYHKFQHAAGQRRRKGPRATARRRASQRIQSSSPGSASSIS
jgi:hypothetical protein